MDSSSRLRRPTSFTPTRRQLSGALLGGALALGCGAGTQAQAPAEPHAAGSQAAPERLRPEKIVYSMRGNEADYRKCFFQAFQHPGRVSTQFVVSPSGAVENVAVTHSEVVNPSITECLRERLMSQKFGERSQTTQGSWTFVFRVSEPHDPEELSALFEEEDERPEEAGVALEPGSLGRVSPGDVEDVALAGYPLFAHCYRDSISRRNEARGILRLRLTIDEEGRLAQAEDAGSLMPDPFAVDCMTEAFYAMDFPKPQGGPATVRYHLELE